MKNNLLAGIMVLIAGRVPAQKIDSICFHLYTDSLKKGTYNYINVDGRLSNGSWRPLTNKEVDFSASYCRFSGNELIIPADFSEEKIKVKATLKSNPAVSIERTIWIKKLPDPEVLPAKDEIMQRPKKKKN